MATLNSTLRSLNAAAKRMDREAKRRQRELERQQKEYDKLLELEQAEYEVEMYENRIAVLQSMHQDCSEKVDWIKIKNSKPPIEPKRINDSELKAKSNFENYKPTIFHKLFGKVEKIQESLKQEIKTAIKKDDETYNNNRNIYEEEKIEWEENVNIASSVLNGDLEGFKQAITKLDPFSEISDLGTELKIDFPSHDTIVVDINVHSEEIIPTETKSLLKSGKLTVKSMPKSKFNEIYQDHIASAVLRIARETFAALPVDKVIVTANSELLNTQTGYKEDTPILSVLIPSETLNKINFASIDPSDSMMNFVHNMAFKKTQGFSGVDKINIENYQ